MIHIAFSQFHAAHSIFALKHIPLAFILWVKAEALAASSRNPERRKGKRTGVAIKYSIFPFFVLPRWGTLLGAPFLFPAAFPPDRAGRTVRALFKSPLRTTLRPAPWGAHATGPHLRTPQPVLHPPDSGGTVAREPSARRYSGKVLPLSRILRRMRTPVAGDSGLSFARQRATIGKL